MKTPTLTKNSSHWREPMKYFEDFRSSDESFESRECQSTLLSALGRLALAHAELHRRMEATIGVLLDDAAPGAPAPPDDPSFDRQADFLGGLITATERRVRFNAGDLHASELRRELVHLLKRAHDLYQGTVDPDLLGVHLRGEAGPELSASIMDLADYVTYADCMLEEFFLDQNAVM